MTYVAPSAPQSIGGVLDDWLRLFRESFSRCWILALVAAAANAYEQSVLIPHMPPPGLPPLQYFTQLASTYRGPQVFLTDLVFWLILLVVYGGLLLQQLALVHRRAPRSAGAALSASLSRFPQMLLGVVLLLVCVGVLGMIIGVGVVVLLRLYHIVIVALLIGVVTLAIIAAVIYGSVRVQFWLTALIDQDLGGPRATGRSVFGPAAVLGALALIDRDLGGPRAIGRSWRLTRGHWWRITGILFVAGIVIWVLSIVFGLVAGLVGGMFAVTGGTATLLHHLRLVVVISSLSRLITLPLLTAVWVAIYHDLMLRHEGSDLAARAEALAGR